MFLLEHQQRENAARDLSLAPSNQAICDEDSLVAKAKSGHGDAFGELYKRHHLRTYRAALHILRNQQDAEDAVQRAFQYAFEKLEGLGGDSTFSTWLTRIVVSEALILLRQRRTRAPLHENSVDGSQGDGGLEIADGRPTPEEILCESERHATLRQAIAQLRENLRVVVLHRELQGLTNAETARRLGLTVSAVKARAFHARRFLRSILNGTLKKQAR